MPVEHLDSLDDPRLAIFRSLKVTNETRGLGQFVVEGAKLVDRLLASRFPVVSILATDRFDFRFETPVPSDVPVYVVPYGLIHELVGFPFHRGVLASGARLAWPSGREILDRATGDVTLTICPQITNPENLGAIARIGDVFGIDALLAGPSCPDPLSRRVLRVSMGSVLRLPVLVPGDLEATIDALSAEFGLKIWAAVADPEAIPYQSLDRPRRLGLVLGDEDRGVDDRWLARCSRSITIPMRPGAGSLNVSVAAGILLQHLSRHNPGVKPGERVSPRPG